MQRVEVNCISSQWLKVQHGVPQGLFLIYINDLPIHCKHLESSFLQMLQILGFLMSPARKCKERLIMLNTG